MPCENPYFAEVLDVHVLIQQWLAGQATADRLADLLGHFSPAFSMVGLAGQPLDYAGLQRLFSQAYGKRPGLAIRIDELQQVAHVEGLAVVSYREYQDDALGQSSVRRSSAIFEQLPDASLRWLRLHETPCAG